MWKYLPGCIVAGLVGCLVWYQWRSTVATALAVIASCVFVVAWHKMPRIGGGGVGVAAALAPAVVGQVSGGAARHNYATTFIVMMLTLLVSATASPYTDIFNTMNRGSGQLVGEFDINNAFGRERLLSLIHI